MGKRRKVQCEICGSVFDNDFKTRHETACHNGKRVRVKEPGASKNPFVAALKASHKNLQDVASSSLLENVCILSHN